MSRHGPRAKTNLERGLYLVPSGPNHVRQFLRLDLPKATELCLQLVHVGVRDALRRLKVTLTDIKQQQKNKNKVINTNTSNKTQPRRTKTTATTATPHNVNSNNSNKIQPRQKIKRRNNNGQQLKKNR